MEDRIRKLPPRPAPAAQTDPAAAQTEQTWLQTLAERANIVKQIDDAQGTLKDAQEQLLDALNSARYKSIKQSLSVLISLGLGLAVAFATNLDIFRLLNLSTNAGVFGVFITGLIIGAGTGPVHSLIGILQQSRDTLDQAANLFSSRARKNITDQYTTLMQANAVTTSQATPSRSPPPASWPRSRRPTRRPPSNNSAPSSAWPAGRARYEVRGARYEVRGTRCEVRGARYEGRGTREEG